MFALPLLTPANTFPLFHNQSSHHAQDDVGPVNPDQPAHQRPPSRRNAQNASNTQSRIHPLALLKADEESIRRRKENIARFGATWIKPPGISKTLQAETEERQEREEQEAIARREQLMMDMAAQQEAEEARQRAAEQEAAEEAGETAEEERDLDEDVPDADALDLDDNDDDDDDEDEDENTEDMDAEATGEVTTADVTFNDDSLLEGSMLADRPPRASLANMLGLGPVPDGEYENDVREQQRYAQLEEAELTGVAQEQMELGMDANLDESVPEAGSYQHTDTELEDDTFDDDEDSFMAPPAGPTARQRTSLLGGLQNTGRSSLRSRESAGSRRSLRMEGSSVLESSFVGSSPVLGRLRSTNNRPGRNS